MLSAATRAAKTHPGTSSFTLQVQINTTKARGTVDPRYVSLALDYPDPRQPGKGHICNVLKIDLTSSKLQMLVTALGPSILRIGGTLDKVVEYDLPGASSCTHPETRPCLTADRWNALHAFARLCNLQIVFGLSYDQVNPKTQPGLWNSSQVEALLQYSVQQGYSRQTTLYGVELGEELTRFEVGTPAFGHYIDAYKKCAILLKTTWHDNIAKPLLMGPAPGMSWPRLATWFPEFLQQTFGALEVAVYHSYNQIQDGKLYLNTTIPSGNLSTQHGASPGDTGWQGVAMNEFVAHANHGSNDNNKKLDLWLGEFGPHNRGGGPGIISSTFASSFGYLDTLGALARLNHLVLARQTLVGGKYELLRCSTGGARGCDFEPLPDYWVGLLWHRLMGTTVLDKPIINMASIMENGATHVKSKTTTTKLSHDLWKEHVRFHAHCSTPSGASGNEMNTKSGSITLAISNTSPNTTFFLDLSQHTNLLGERRVEYVLGAHPPSAGFQARAVELNGSVLQVGNNATPRLPPLEGRAYHNNQDPIHGRVMLSPITLGFIRFPDATARACRMANQIIGTVKQQDNESGILAFT